MKRWLGALLALGVPAAASAVAPSCAIPADLERPHAEGASASQPARTVPITRYTLALIWTPQHCHAAVGGAGAYRCAAGDAGRGFTLHGLWPDGDDGSWPQWCKPAAILSPSVIRAHYCATPSAQLLQHEWAKHGTCIAGATPDRFFTLSNRLFAKLRTPDMAALAARPSLTAADVAGAFAAANRGIGTDAIRLNLSRDGWLEEVWICLDKGYKAETCPADQGGMFGSRPVRVAPPA